MTITTKHDIGSKHTLQFEGGQAAFVVQAMTIRVNTPTDVRIIYEGTLYQHTNDKSGKLIRWGAERPFSFDESRL